MKVWDYLCAYLRTSRAEYLIAEVPALFVIYFVGASGYSRILAPEVIEGLVVFLCLYFGGFIINAYTDQGIDSKYTIFKNKIPVAVELIGQRMLLTILAAQVIVAFILTIHISHVMMSWLPLALIGTGAFFGLGYSLPPLQFKVRGIWHAVSLILSALFLPAIFLFYIIAGTVTLPALVIILGVSMLHYGIAIANQAIDYLEDRAGGVRSPPVRWGMENSLRVALAAIFAGMAVVFAGLYLFVAERSGLLAFLPGWSPAQLFAILVPIVLIGYYIPVSGLWRMYRASLTRPIAEATRFMKDICRYNQWQASGIIGLAVATGILFFGA